METREKKNIVVCCDGTGNEISENISNVLKLYRCLRKTGKAAAQIVFYDPGVGTLARPNPWTRFRQNTVMVLGLATGYGLDDNVLSAYRFLIQNYQEGDDIYLFGFSRGAYTVRVLAGLIHKIGILAPQQSNLADAGLTAYKQASASIVEQEELAAGSAAAQRGDAGAQPGPKSRDDQASQFARIASTRWATIRFLGVWDTVASVIVPRPDRFYTFSLQQLAFTRRNPSVKVFRQASAIDERRRMFRLEPWQDGQAFMHNRFSETNNAEPQDSQQVWFSGVHSDIGGGYPEKESGLSKHPLLWMIGEAQEAGLAVDAANVNQLAWGVQRKNSPFSYVAPAVDPEPHNSMNAVWQALEWLPKADKYKEWSARRSFLGQYIPNAEPRAIPPGAFVHQSVLDRIGARPDYQPENLPPDHRIVPMPSPPAARPAQDEP